MDYIEYVLVGGLGIFAVLVFLLAVLTIRIRRFLDHMESFSTRLATLVEQGSESVMKAVSGAEDTLDALNAVIGPLNDRLDRMEKELHSTLKEANNTMVATQHLEAAVEDLVREIGPVIENSKNISREVERISSEIRHRIEQTQDFFNAAEDTAKTVRGVTGVVRSGILGAAIEAAGLATGIKASLEYLAKKLEKGGKSK